MKITYGSIALSFLMMFQLQADVPLEIVSDAHQIVPVAYQKTTNGDLSRLEIVRGIKGFDQRIKNCEKPVFLVVAPAQITPFHDICSSLAARMRNVRFMTLDAQRNKWFLDLLKERLNQKEDFQFPLLVFLNKGKVILPVSSGSLNEDQLTQAVCERFGLIEKGSS